MASETNPEPNTQVNPKPTALSNAYYHWLGGIYAHLLDNEQHGLDTDTNAVINAANSKLAPHEYHPDLVDTLRLDIAKAKTTLRHDKEGFAAEWKKIEADLAVKLLSIADKTDVELNALRDDARHNHP
ncbi:MAG: zinc ribbon-containing protein [Halothiobacillus sp.]